MKLNMSNSVLMIACALVAQSAFASAGNYTLQCDDNNIFETPLVIHVDGEKAAAEGSFSGPGDAIFDINYRNLVAEEQGDGSLSLREPGFSLKVKYDHAEGKLRGKLKVTSTDEDRMPYSGAVTCERR